jgi:hypothetical protein
LRAAESSAQAAWWPEAGLVSQQPEAVCQAQPAERRFQTVAEWTGFREHQPEEHQPEAAWTARQAWARCQVLQENRDGCHRGRQGHRGAAEGSAVR